MENIWINIVDSFSLFKFFEVYMMAESKTITLSVGLFIVCRCKISDRHSRNKGGKRALYVDKVALSFTLKWSTRVMSVKMAE